MPAQQPRPRVRYLGPPRNKFVMLQNGGLTQRHRRRKWSFFLTRPADPSDFEPGSNPRRLSVWFRHSDVVWHGGITAHGATPAYRRRNMRAAIAAIERAFGPDSIAFTQGPVSSADGSRLLAAVSVTREAVRPLSVRFQRN